VQIKGEMGGLKGMAKKIISGVGQQVFSVSLRAACWGRAVARKHHRAAYLLLGGVAASGAPTSGSGMLRVRAIATFSFWTVNVASDW
jgi:hypothetical protein